MPRTPLASCLQRIALDTHATRRQFLGAAGAVAVEAAFGAPRARAVGSTAKVVVVGAGLAGLTAAYRLKQAGVDANVYEGSSRLGGRCWSLRGVFADEQVAEHGGELIDTGHIEIRQLCKELRLPLDNLLQGEQNGTEPLYYFDDRPTPTPRRPRTSTACTRRCTPTSRRPRLRRLTGFRRRTDGSLTS